ncbi:substrate-binding domain-containing protein [Mesorhizobium sp. CA13]|uniref:substrate-binding domain-containing protein n=2 Tax=Mesorhizobium TaxID=68287 RepID=UPI001CCE4ED5|nr:MULTISPECIES: substrate-binding domain-containing protein [unclassified Mesorhizobium]MBZ9857444.1 substrate-binding domain-containing protein [Mesorhizobium sp. CA13]MBZ9966651.1 substrate-binding domain-containing protein [Mesorhizobium sp. BR1-1-2]MCA0014812.1 substrate-binding domain-containing protein [Mesorhizobium sp. B294B1A1]MCA0041067.1 substrate-binding domain-containing protein [Mesorhizobium sp. B292B1B]
MNSRLTAIVACAALATGLALTGATRADDIKIGYINKMGEHPWFVAEVGGAKKAAEAAGAAFVSQDVQFDANLAVTTFDTMVGDGVKGIAIVVPDKALGPVIAQKAKTAGIPLVAVDDDIYYQDGSQVPYVGMNAHNIGARVGEELAKLYKADGWAGKEVRIASIEDRKADTCMQRNKGAEEAFLKAVPDFKPNNIIRVAYDNTMVNAIDVMTTTLTANPNVTNWIFYSCNDDGVLGAARALQNAGYKADQGMGIGIDGSRACDAFGSAEPSAFRGTMWLNSANHGALAVKLLLAAIKDKTPLPVQSFTDPEYITPANFASDYKAKLCH